MSLFVKEGVTPVWLGLGRLTIGGGLLTPYWKRVWHEPLRFIVKKPCFLPFVGFSAQYSIALKGRGIGIYVAWRVDQPALVPCNHCDGSGMQYVCGWGETRDAKAKAVVCRDTSHYQVCEACTGTGERLNERN